MFFPVCKIKKHLEKAYKPTIFPWDLTKTRFLNEKWFFSNMCSSFWQGIWIKWKNSMDKKEITTNEWILILS